MGKGISAFIAVFLWLPASPALAAELPPPAGQVVLTVAGNIENTNRGPFDAFEDAFLNYHSQEFKKAFAFDLAMLEALGLSQTMVTYAGWPKPVVFDGPRLSDVLKTAGWQGDKIVILALDGYATELTRAEVMAQNWIVATKANGRPLGIGQHGPLWIVYSLPDGQAAAAEDEQSWPWSAFFITVE